VELYLFIAIRLHDVVLNRLSTGATLPLHIRFAVSLKQPKLGNACYILSQYGKCLLLSFTELLDMYLVLGECSVNSADSVGKYREIFPKRRVSSRLTYLSVDRRLREKEYDGMLAFRVLYVMYEC
jgi:hypothetical protein